MASFLSCGGSYKEIQMFANGLKKPSRENLGCELKMCFFFITIFHYLSAASDSVRSFSSTEATHLIRKLNPRPTACHFSALTTRSTQ